MVRHWRRVVMVNNFFLLTRSTMVDAKGPTRRTGKLNAIHKKEAASVELVFLYS